MQEESTDIEKSAPKELPFGTETIGETTRSLFAMAPLVLEPGLIVLEKFKIIDLLGQGGMGSVYRVEHLLMGRQFALKCLNKFQEADASWRRFQNEAKAAHLLDHANLLKVYEFGLLPGGQPFFLMELVEGVTLADEIKRLGQLPVERAVRIFIQVAFALSYAHESHVIHRDIKPSNIMVSSKGQKDDAETVKVVDFGIAKLTGIDEFNQQTLTKTGEIFGSPLYMSPEQCTGVAVDHRSDLYSLGCVFYETLTGAPPFMGETALSTMMKHQGEQALSLKEASLGTQYPLMLEEIVSKLLEKDPNQRYQSANALAKDLIMLERRMSEESQSSLSAVATTQTLTKPVLQKSKKDIVLGAPTVSVLLALAAVVFALGALTSYVLLSPGQKNGASTAPAVESKEFKYEDKLTLNNPDLVNQRATAEIKGFDKNYEQEIQTAKHWSTIEGSKRVYRFPQKQSLGLILTDSGVMLEALGEVSLNSDALIGLVPNEYLVKHPELMDKFSPDELTLIDMNSSHLKMTDFCQKLTNFPKLKFLNAFYTPFGQSIEVLSKLKELRHLDVAWCKIDCRQLLKYVHGQDLNYLNLSNDDHARAIIENIHMFPKLRQLLLAHTDLNNEDLKGLSKARLFTLCLAWNRDLDDRGIENLKEMKTLAKIDLSNTNVTPEVWKVLVGFPHLQTVKLAKIRWNSTDKIYFCKQIRLHSPYARVDFDISDFHEFTQAATDIDWANIGCNAHDWPGEQFAKQNIPILDKLP